MKQGEIADMAEGSCGRAKREQAKVLAFGAPVKQSKEEEYSDEELIEILLFEVEGYKALSAVIETNVKEIVDRYVKLKKVARARGITVPKSIANRDQPVS